MPRIESSLVDRIAVFNSLGESEQIFVIQSFLIYRGVKQPGRSWLETKEGHYVDKTGPLQFTIQATGEVLSCRRKVRRLRADDSTIIHRETAEVLSLGRKTSHRLRLDMGTTP